MRLTFLVTFALASLALATAINEDSTGSCQADSCDAQTNKQKQTSFPAPGGDFASFGLKHIRGRLGNHLFGFMMALGLQMTYGINGVVSRETMQFLQQ